MVFGLRVSGFVTVVQKYMVSSLCASVAVGMGDLVRHITSMADSSGLSVHSWEHETAFRPDPKPYKP